MFKNLLCWEQLSPSSLGQHELGESGDQITQPRRFAHTNSFTFLRNLGNRVERMSPYKERLEDPCKRPESENFGRSKQISWSKRDSTWKGISHGKWFRMERDIFNIRRREAGVVCLGYRRSGRRQWMREFKHDCYFPWTEPWYVQPLLYAYCLKGTGSLTSIDVKVQR